MALPPTSTASSATISKIAKLPDNSDMFKLLQKMFKQKEVNNLKANFMKVSHDIRMSLVRNIR